jgi:putative FmdB family regulatory protein
LPNYGYRCQSCQREFEVQQRMSDPPQASCPDCGGAGTRLFYPTGILFKGSGFYKTDSRSAPAASPAPSAGAAKPATDGAGESAKPAAPSKESPSPAPAAAPKSAESSKSSPASDSPTR